LGWIIIVVGTLLLTFDAMRSGPARAAVIVVTSSIALFIYSLIPYTYFLDTFVTTSTSLVSAAIFGGLFIFIFLLMHRIVFNLGSTSDGLVMSFIAGVCGMIAVTITWLHVPALMMLWNPGSEINLLFGLPYALGWFIGIYIVLAFLRS